jgi:hypothetical protein
VYAIQAGRLQLSVSGCRLCDRIKEQAVHEDEPEYAVHKLNADALHVPFFIVEKRMIG